MTITYKNIEYKDENPIDLDAFNGYKIVKERNTLSVIKTYSGGEEIGCISFRPTVTPVIFSVQYGNYREERYSSNKVAAKYMVHDEALYGQYMKYNTQGELQETRYYSNNVDVTTEIMEFINYKGTREDFNTYKFLEDEEFNLMMRYGSHFKFIHENGTDSSTFDSIVKNCL